MKQKTIAKELEISGIGLHSGEVVSIKLIPSEMDGINFRNTRNKTEYLLANYKNIIDTNLGTTISNNSFKVLTIEHLMAAIWASDIDDLIVEIDGNEIPIMDGSCSIFIEEIQNIGTITIDSERKFLCIKKEIIVDNNNSYIKVLPNNDFFIDMNVEYEYGDIGKQNYHFSGNKNEFIKNISKARTFCNLKDIEYMHKIGLARGGSLNNSMVFDNNSLINKNGFRYENEVVRHKILDCVGDIFTSGFNIKGAIYANKSGHSLNNQLLKKIFENIDNYSIE